MNGRQKYFPASDFQASAQKKKKKRAQIVLGVNIAYAFELEL